MLFGLEGAAIRPQVLELALSLARMGLPVLPLRAGKVPVGNCLACRDGACGGRPTMKAHGPCRCAAPCHAWAAATTDPAVLTGPAWASAWREAQGVAYHPGGAGLTVLDLDNAQAVAWARDAMPATLTVPTTRGEHWIYWGAMASANAVRPGVDIKSHAGYVRWLGTGTGVTAPLPDSVRALARREEATPARTGAGVASSTTAWDRSVNSGCRHTDRYLDAGLRRGLAKIAAHRESGAGSQAFGVARFLAAQHTCCPGPCGLGSIARHILDAAVAVGVPHDYATRAITNGFTAAGAHLP
ncbi:bifunctional DNA primase/polymerase [Kitasatospora sp. NPDC051702]|uniref:bifunctional DNA primase/polymerase n=1 Tax=Kitasatospora sp. NPDC051702 TaxID=3155672 RepID=UPI0034129993